MHSCSCTRVQVQSCAVMLAQPHTLVHSCPCALVPAQLHTLMQLYSYAVVRLCSCACTIALSHTLVQSCPCALVLAQLHTIMHSCFRACTILCSCTIMHLCGCTFVRLCACAKTGKVGKAQKRSLALPAYMVVMPSRTLPTCFPCRTCQEPREAEKPVRHG